MASAPLGQPRAQAAPIPGSQTQTQTSRSTNQQQTGTATQAILRLRGAHSAGGPSVRWRDDVVDNEGLDRKKSKGKYPCVSLSHALHLRSEKNLG